MESYRGCLVAVSVARTDIHGAHLVRQLIHMRLRRLEALLESRRGLAKAGALIPTRNEELGCLIHRLLLVHAWIWLVHTWRRRDPWHVGGLEAST